ncbi:MAG: SpoIIE family protein phosphatase [Leptospirales bacterium]|jgi:serine phosphatase RsbU (regulator of sigma subunit)/Tfp pilus assembly protein PilF
MNSPSNQPRLEKSLRGRALWNPVIVAAFAPLLLGIFACALLLAAGHPAVHESGAKLVGESAMAYAAPTLILLAGLLATTLLWFGLWRPVRRMRVASTIAGQAIADRDFDRLQAEPLPESGGGDLSRFAEIFNRLTGELQANRTLLRKVEALSREMEEQVLQTSKMKFEQDGDYFLTAQLIKPLARSSVRSDRVSVDMFVRQKKQFRFKKWDEQLGGDLCVAHTLQLRGRPCTVFLNADAMGKSMQGAGGVLVLGSLFEANIERSKLSLDVQNQSPELWIKHSFVELQRVFETFESTMFISLVLGVVDDQTGTLYYVNAEHPGMVLYRDGKAVFLETDMPLQKIGFPEVNHRSVKIQVFPMKAGDVIFSGSDGRDDLHIGIGADGERIINDNDDLILNMIELGGGNLKRLVETIDRIGQITDDLSLIRVGYLDGPTAGSGSENQSTESGSQESLQAKNAARALLQEAQSAADQKDYPRAVEALERARKTDPAQKQILKHLARVCTKANQWDRAADLAEEYVKDCPHDTEFLFSGAKMMLRAGRLEPAEDLCERYRLRIPESTKNLKLLSQILYKTGKEGRAYVMEKEAEAMESIELMRSGDAAAAGLIG